MPSNILPAIPAKEATAPAADPTARAAIPIAQAATAAALLDIFSTSKFNLPKSSIGLNIAGPINAIAPIAKAAGPASAPPTANAAKPPPIAAIPPPAWASALPSNSSNDFIPSAKVGRTLLKI